MPSINALPNTAEAWLQKLDAHALPIPVQQHEQLRRAMDDNNCSLREIATMLQSCPALALRLLREANHQKNDPDDTTQSLESALARLGLKRAEALLDELPTTAAHAIGEPLRQIQLISQHALQQAKGLFLPRLARLQQETLWGSLLFLSPLWVLLSSHPQLYNTWTYRVLLKGEPSARVEQELLGLSLFRLCLILAEHWRLPTWIIQGYQWLTHDQRLPAKALRLSLLHRNPLRQQQTLDADTRLQHWLTQPSNSIVLANLIAISAHIGWNERHTLRWQWLTSLYLQTPIGPLQQQIHQESVSSARLLDIDTLWHPAQALLWPWESKPALAQLPAQAAPGNAIEE
jgi:HD-like signal output (HDOD) protein